MPLDTAPFQARRTRLLATMQAAGGGVAIIPTAPERIRNRDTHYGYRFDSYFYYLTGFREPEAVLVLVAGDTPRSLLFCRSKDMEREIWDGYRFGPEAARETFGFDEAYPIAELDTQLGILLANQPAIFHSMGYEPSWDTRITDALNRVRAQARTGCLAPTQIRDVRSLIDEMRLIKDASELATMRQAARISGGAHRRAMQATRPGAHEYEIEAELIHEFRRHGSQAPAYGSIVAGGANACVLHYVENDGLLRDGDLLLIDAGCELDGYASDITRTFPVNGRFSGPQKAAYELVLASQAAAIAATRPGAGWNEPHDAATRVLAQGFIDLGLLEGSLDGVLESGSYRQFYMHRTGHWLGLDVHDAGEYKLAGEWRPLVPGNVLTVEPGCYIRPADGVPEAFWNIGIRIEDDALVTDSGCDILTLDTPKSVADIEALMAARA
ncbi:MAG: Xaa-Pro aminopeptidase [Zoogloea sp.]|uniref:Xaa-Pro aminopeptidase n=1 Tax=Zoogloea sp. TaxID=49181 RepID=UPI00260EC086|nr:Xaa-Pro aminopeptidase [Zoogloea sp.]MDD2988524.1 Xaa-Pro aminopeptidase [Zoogloea sp.]